MLAKQMCIRDRVKAYDSATVKAYDSATVKACGSATVEAYGSATVEACGSATVEAYGSATAVSYTHLYVPHCKTYSANTRERARCLAPTISRKSSRLRQAG